MAAGLDDVIITAELRRRHSRVPNLNAENQALHALARQLTGTPRELIDRLVVIAMEICKAGSAGVGVLAGPPGAEQIIRWEAMAGAWAGYAGSSRRVASSPSGPALARGAAQLYAYPARHFTHLDDLLPPLVEALFVPFSTDEAVLGAIWIGTHHERRQFDAEDVRLLTSLAGFAAAGLRITQLLETQRQRASSAQEQTELHVQLNAALREAGEQSDARRRQSEERVAALEELDRLKDDLLAIASHDLKSPLTSIRGYAQLLLRGVATSAYDPLQVRQALTVIDMQVDAMARMLDDLLDAARIQAGTFALQVGPCDLGTCLAGVLARLKPEDRDRVDVNLAEQRLGGRWECRQIERVLANLLDNAIKYSPAGGRALVAAEERGGEVAVAVSDRGVGIPATELPRLFERFHRTPQARASGLSGTGLGLFICRGIVEAHGGRIWAESPGEGQGATLRFSLPTEPPTSAAGPRG